MCIMVHAHGSLSIHRKYNWTLKLHMLLMVIIGWYRIDATLIDIISQMYRFNAVYACNKNGFSQTKYNLFSYLYVESLTLSSLMK